MNTVQTNTTLLAPVSTVGQQLIALQLNNRESQQQQLEMTRSQMELFQTFIQRDQARDETISRLMMEVGSMRSQQAQSERVGQTEVQALRAEVSALNAKVNQQQTIITNQQGEIDRLRKELDQEKKKLFLLDMDLYTHHHCGITGVVSYYNWNPNYPTRRDPYGRPRSYPSS